jgi:ubiquinone/menaquinone biosynthesis C-methylase UbiE
VRTTEEQTLTEDFRAQYQRHQSPVLRAVERKACGCDYGGTSWTTRDEADRICGLLGLRSGQKLLEVGAGSGWPGLYLAGQMKCDVVFVDLPIEGLHIGAQRAVDDGLAERCRFAVADGAALPFDDRNFDAISHSDVLCCLDAKAAVLNDCRRVIRPGGTMVFTVISVTPGLSSESQARALEFGPPFVDSACDYAAMLDRCGWHVRDREDITGEWAQTTQRYLREQGVHRKALEDLRGKEDFDAQQTRMREKIAAIDDGLLHRELYVSSPSTDGS